MAYTTIVLFLLFVWDGFVYGSEQYLFSNFDIKPDFAILNSTSTSIFICTKQNDDNQDFEISTIPVILQDNVKIYERRRNKTAMDIFIDSSGFIGTFRLICSSIDNQSVGIPADVYIGNSPGEFKFIKPCIVYENQYIDCIIQMPSMISVIQNEYPYSFDFMEIHQSSSEENAYNQPGKLVKIDEENQTITFRWFPIHTNIFPSRLKMLISGTVKYFGTTNLTIDITPNIWIRPNITIENISSSSFQIQIHHDLPLSCRGNLTIDDRSRIENQKDNIRRFKTTNLTVIYMNDLNANTWYQLCIQCQRNTSFNSINEVQCLRKQTKRSWVWMIYLILISIVIIIMIIDIIICRRFGWKNIVRKSRNNINHVIIIPNHSGAIELDFMESSLSEQPVTTAESNRETEILIEETRV